MITCHFCNATIGSIDESIEANWFLSFWGADSEVDRPVCPKCIDYYLQFNERYGDFEVRPDLLRLHLRCD
jgi:hypothetical protein